MNRLGVAAVVLAAGLTLAGTGVAYAQPAPAPAPSPAPTTEQLSPQNPGGTTPGVDEVPIQEPKTGGVQWDQFGGNPTDAPKDLDSFVDDILGYLRTFTLYAAAMGVLIVAGALMIGIRGRSEHSKRALETLPAVLIGTVIAGAAGTVLSMFVI